MLLKRRDVSKSSALERSGKVSQRGDISVEYGMTSRSLPGRQGRKMGRHGQKVQYACGEEEATDVEDTEG